MVEATGTGARYDHFWHILVQVCDQTVTFYSSEIVLSLAFATNYENELVFNCTETGTVPSLTEHCPVFSDEKIAFTFQ